MFMRAISDLEMGIAIKLASNKYLDDLYDEFMSYNVSDVEVNPKINKRISRKISFSEWKDVRVAVAKVSKIAVMFACCIISAFFLAAMCITPVRAAFTGAILTWYDEYVTVHYGSNQQEDDSELVIKKPTYIPEGYELTSEYSGENRVSLEYRNENGYSIIYNSQKANSLRIDDDIILSKKVLLNGELEATLYLNENEDIILVWNDDMFFYIDSTEGLEKEIIKIAESIK